MKDASLYYVTGLLTDGQLWVSTSTETLIEGLVLGYSEGADHAARAKLRHNFLLAAATACQEGLIEQAIEEGKWNEDTAPTWERDRLRANKAGRGPSAGVWSCAVPLVLVQSSHARARAKRTAVKGNVLILEARTPAHLLISLKKLGMVDAGHVNGKSKVHEPYL
jgi:hypothetical protein